MKALQSCETASGADDSTALTQSQSCDLDWLALGRKLFLVDQAMERYLKHCSAPGRVLIGAFVFARCAILALVVFWGVNSWFISSPLLFLMSSPTLIVAYVVPILILSVVDNRKSKVIKEAMIFVDLLKVSTVCKGNARGSMLQVGLEISDSCPILSSEIESIRRSNYGITHERLGEELCLLAERADSHELQILAEAVCAGESNGVDPVFILEQQSNLFRNYWRNNQETRARSFTLKACLLAAIFVLPLTVVFILGPALITCIGCNLRPIGVY